MSEHHQTTDHTPMTNTLTDDAMRFGSVSKLNHWISAALFLGAFGLGIFIENGGLSREAIGPYMQWHKAFGVSVLIYGLWRVGWRVASGFPKPVAPVPAWQDKSARVVHIGLLAAILAMPISGIAMNLAGGRDLSIWGLTLLSSPGEIHWLDTVAETVHGAAPPIILLLLVLHIGGALKHHFIDRDATLRRMTAG